MRLLHPSTHRRALLALIVVCAAWGLTFVVVKDAVDQAPVMSFLAWRFVLATVLLWMVRPRAMMTLSWRDIRRSVLIGLALGAGYFTQSLGLRTTSAAVSGFLTGLQVVIVPVISWAIFRRTITRRMLGAVIVSLAGVGVLSLHGFSISSGDLLTLACAFFFGLQIAALETQSTSADPVALATIQLGVVGIGALISTLPRGPGLPHSASVYWAVVICAVAATAFAFTVQNWAQQRLSATHVSVVFSMEPVFAALFAWVWGEQLRWSVFAGGALVLSAMLFLGMPQAQSDKTLRVETY